MHGHFVSFLSLFVSLAFHFFGDLHLQGPLAHRLAQGGAHDTAHQHCLYTAHGHDHSQKDTENHNTMRMLF